LAAGTDGRRKRMGDKDRGLDVRENKRPNSNANTTLYDSTASVHNPDKYNNDSLEGSNSMVFCKVGVLCVRGFVDWV